MKKLTTPAISVILFAIVICFSSGTALPQRPTYPKAPQPMNTDQAPQVPVNAQRQIDLVQLQREADELAQTAGTIPADVASVRRGMLPKDMIQKLKQIEKLSKRLRSELTP